jgi:hypothetical protein
MIAVRATSMEVPKGDRKGIQMRQCSAQVRLGRMIRDGTAQGCHMIIV